MKIIFLSFLLITLALPIDAQEDLLTHFLDSLKASQPKARELIEKASSGDAESMFQLAMCYRRGQSVNALEEAAQMGNHAAKAIVYAIYKEGLYGQDANPELADYWYNKFMKDNE
jgi:TPR repeat protein